MVSTKFTLKAIAAILPFLPSANAHMIMKTPVPYGKSTLNNSPLAGDGSDFPCKQRAGVYDAEGASNVMAVGSSQTLSFTGSAVHGGGSCQVSLTTDLKPTKDSKWMVIKSIEGGCPADVSGNLPADPNGNGAATFQYTIPEGIAPGEYTIAWSWVNKIGNREFYMNCGPATITAAKKKRYAPTPKTSKNPKRAASFPDLFVANLAGVSNGCTTKEGVDITFPNPGADVQKSADGTFAPPDGCAGGSGSNPAQQPQQASSQAAGGVSSAAATAAASTFAAGNPATSSAAAAATSAAGNGGYGGNGGQTTQTGGRGQQTGQPGVFATGAAQATSTATVVPVKATTAAGAAATASSSSGNLPASSFSGSTTPGSACSTEGQWACSSSGTSFQRCASGTWSQSMQMAAGTTCTPGISSNINMIVTNVKRHQALHAAHKLHSFFRRSS